MFTLSGNYDYFQVLETKQTEHGLTEPWNGKIRSGIKEIGKEEINKSG